MAFDILDKNGVVIHDGGVIRIKATASDVFPFSISHHGGNNAAAQAVKIESDASQVILEWNEAHLDSHGKKKNTLGPSMGLCGDGTLTIKVGHEAAKTLAFRFFKAV